MDMSAPERPALKYRREQLSVIQLQQLLGFKSNFKASRISCGPVEPLSRLELQLWELAEEVCPWMPKDIRHSPIALKKYDDIFEAGGADLWPDPGIDRYAWLVNPGLGETYNGRYCQDLYFSDPDHRKLMREIFQLLLTEEIINLRTNRRAGRGETRKPRISQGSPILYTGHVSGNNAPSLPTSSRNIVAMDVSRQPSKRTEEPLMPAQSANTEQQPDARSTSGHAELPLPGRSFPAPLALPPKPSPELEVLSETAGEAGSSSNELHVASGPPKQVARKLTLPEERQMEIMDEVLDTSKVYLQLQPGSWSEDHEVSLKQCYTCDRLFDRIDNIVPNTVSDSFGVVAELKLRWRRPPEQLFKIARGRDDQFQEVMRALVLGWLPHTIAAHALNWSGAQQNQPQPQP